MRLAITDEDRRRGRRGNAGACVVSRAGERTWGGSWSAAPGSASREAGGKQRHWAIGPAGSAGMVLYDMGLPFLPRSVKLVSRGSQIARRAALSGVILGAASLYAIHLAWLIFVILAMAAAVLIAIAAARLRPAARPVTVWDRARPAAPPRYPRVAPQWPNIRPDSQVFLRERARGQ